VKAARGRIRSAAAVAALVGLAACASRDPLWEDQPRLTKDVVAAILDISPGSVDPVDRVRGRCPLSSRRASATSIRDAARLESGLRADSPSD